MNTTLINAGGDEVNSEIFVFNGSDRLANSIIAEGLGSGETVKIQFTSDNGTNWTDAYVNTIQVALTSTNNIMTLNCIGRFRAVKSATAGIVKCTLITEDC